MSAAGRRGAAAAGSCGASLASGDGASCSSSQLLQEGDGDELDQGEEPAEGELGGRVAVELAFRKYDADGSGAISAGELGELCAELGAELSDAEVRDALRRLDLNADGTIGLDEFVAWWEGRAGPEGGEEGEEGRDALDAKLRQLATQGRRENATDVFAGAWKGSLSEVREFVRVDRELASAADESVFGEKNTALHYAAYQGHVDVIEFLVGAGASINARNEAGCTPLFMASQQAREGAVRALLKLGARINVADSKHGLSALEVAGSEPVRLLLAADCDTSVPRRPSRAAQLESPAFGALRVTWTYRGAEAAPGKSLAVKGFTVQLVRSEQRLFSDDEAAAEEEEDEAKGGDGPATDGSVIKEVFVPGFDTSKLDLTGLVLDGYVQARVAAVNASGASDFSDLSESVLAAGAPSVLQPPKVTMLSKTSVSVAWDKPAANGAKITGYRLQACAEGGQEWDNMLTAQPATREVTLDKLQPGRAYQFRIICSNAVGRSKPGPASQPLRLVGSAWAASKK
jgi:hypothetical protein